MKTLEIKITDYEIKSGMDHYTTILANFYQLSKDEIIPAIFPFVNKSIKWRDF